MPPKRFPKREPVGRRPPAVARQNLDIPVAGSSETPDDQIQNTEEELNFCIHQLKLSLHSKKLTPKQIDAIKKDVTILENPQELMVKKRCIMKMSLGDYRKKMEMEKRKVPLGLRNAAIGTASTSTGQFMRKSHLVIDQENKDKFSFQHSDNSFRFNFDSGQKE
ncbi:hypothetical protein DAPPUDRAFT_311991 [Daphnia pulex]|uniref:Uncharacterized protein n=1 Tax=Daphnia pulex TaxID=6669 RepID=E9FYI8_DAPPU|nr:hypothetical protein DAPPUDRAFT_311991 [Daphnia pulex]|eukprot:EFX87759.1 hypothetical protein DAPPUDRAFT_311991 [Daphnia pulex]